MKSFHLSKLKKNRRILETDYIPDNPNRNNKESKADKITHRLRQEKRGKLLKKPENESFHVIHELSHPQA